MITSVESRLWLAVHLLYPNSSQAFDVYQAIVLQSKSALRKEDRAFIFSKLTFVFDKIPAISSGLSFYEFEFDQIDQWKTIYKNSQKVQLLIFIGVLIFELKISEMAPFIKLSQEKIQFLFHQTFKKMAQNGLKTKYNEELYFKKLNDLKISYLFTYENLIEYCLDQLSEGDRAKTEKGLQLYPALQMTRDEYLKIINQIQNLKVQRSILTLPKTKTKLTLVRLENLTENSTNDFAETLEEESTKPVPAQLYKNKNFYTAITFTFVVVTLVLFKFASVNEYFTGSEKTVVIQQIQKKYEPREELPEIALESLPKQDVASENVASENAVSELLTASQDVSQTTAQTSPAAPTVVAESARPSKPTELKLADAKPQGGLYRGYLTVKNLGESNNKVLNKLILLGAKKAGEVELGWLKSNGTAYYHFTVSELNVEQVTSYFKQLGRLDIKFETHPRLITAGNKRFIIEIKGE